MGYPDAGAILLTLGSGLLAVAVSKSVCTRIFLRPSHFASSNAIGQVKLWRLMEHEGESTVIVRVRVSPEMNTPVVPRHASSAHPGYQQRLRDQGEK